ENCLLGRTASAGHGLAAAVKEAQRYALLGCDDGEKLLRASYGRTGGEKADLLARIAVPHHHLLNAALVDVSAVNGIDEQLAEDRGTVGERAQSFEERNDVERHLRALGGPEG